MTINQIQTFLTLASTLSFTRTAEVMHTSQPNVSKLTARLEKELSMKLLSHERRKVTLTPAGEVFQAEMKKLMTQYSHALKLTARVSSGTPNSLDIGFLGTATARHLPKIISKFRERHPDILLNLTDYTYSPLIEALADEKIDIALLPDRELDFIPNLSKKLIFADDMCLVTSRDHPCAEADSVELTAFRDEPFIMIDPKISKADNELVKAICVEQGFTPKVAYEANTLNNIILLIECGAGFSILAKHMSHFATENVSFIRIKGYESYFRVSCVWHSRTNECIHRFLDVVEECMETPEAASNESPH